MIHILAVAGAGLGAWIALGLLVWPLIVRPVRRAAARTNNTPPRPR